MYKFAKLDFFMIKPYLKRYLLILIAISIPMIITTSDVYIMSFMSVFYGIIIISYPFIFSEKNNIENFYGTLSVNKRNIVNGRYIFALFITIMFTIISCICMALGAAVLKNTVELNEAVFMVSLALAVTFILLAVQLPIYFRFGYTKGKIFTYIPFFLLGIGVPLIAKLTPSGFGDSLKSISVYIENNSVTVSIIGILCSLVIFEISNIISQKLYLKKSI